MTRRAPSPWLTGFLVLVVIALILGGLYMGRPGLPVPLAPEPGPAPVHVRELKLETRHYQSHVFGQTAPVRSVQMASEQSGLVQWRSELLEIGGQVVAGEALVVLDDGRLKLILDAARASQASASAVVDLRQTESQAAEAELTNARQAEPLAQREADRQRSLAESGTGSEAIRDRAIERWIAAQGRVSLAEANLNRARSAIQTAQIQADQTGVAIRQAEDEIARCTLRAPFAGRISATQVELGAWLAPGMPICEIVDCSTLKVEVQIPSSDAQLMLPEQSLRLSLPAFTDAQGGPLRLHASLHAIAPVARADTRARLLEARLENSELQLPAGAFAEVWVDLGPHQAVWLRPSEFRLGAQGAEAIVVQDEVAQIRPLVLGRVLVDEAGLTWHPVISGLMTGEFIAIDNLDAPRDGQSVRVMP